MSRESFSALLILIALPASALQSQKEQLGSVHFATSCRTGVASKFDRAVALLHSFEFSESIRAAIREINPNLAIFNVRTMTQVVSDSLWELRLYRRIATMDAAAPLPALPDQLPTWDKAAALAREWELPRLAERLDALFRASKQEQK